MVPFIVYHVILRVISCSNGNHSSSFMFQTCQASNLSEEQEIYSRWAVKSHGEHGKAKQRKKQGGRKSNSEAKVKSFSVEETWQFLLCYQLAFSLQPAKDTVYRPALVSCSVLRCHLVFAWQNCSKIKRIASNDTACSSVMSISLLHFLPFSYEWKYAT